MLRSCVQGGNALSQPAYHLRPNKAVDRFLLGEVIQRMRAFGSLSEYTYYGFGGPYLEDFRYLYERHEDLTMVSLEQDSEIVKRQRFHLPSRKLHLREVSFGDFLEAYEPNGEKAIFWLDYTRLSVDDIDDFMVLLQTAEKLSVVKISLRAQSSDYHGKPGVFEERFKEFIPTGVAEPRQRLEDFAIVIQDMVRIAVEKALRGFTGIIFQPISSFCYRDTSGMFTLTGIICREDDEYRIRSTFGDWEFANFDWNPPRRIDVPMLSTKERLHLQNVIPCDDSAIKMLQFALGYALDGSGTEATTLEQLKQYASFHRQYPYFIRAIP